MTDDNMRMASFRIDRDLWARFSSIAKRERYTVTEALTEYIQICTDNDKLELSVNTGNDAVDNNEVMTDNYSNETVMMMVNTAIDELLPIHTMTRQEVRDVVGEAIKDSISEIETYTKNQIESLRDDLKKQLAIAK